MISVLNRKDRVIYGIFAILWVVLNLGFWIWWLQVEHIGNPLLFTLMCLGFFYILTILPTFYIYYVGRMKRPENKVPSDAAKKVRKVAMITLTVPGSESIKIVEKQLKAMSKVRFPHDNWILVDKEHSKEIAKLAKKYGVNYFSRYDTATWGTKNIKKWNQAEPPFKTKTKAGNVNAWINAVGSQYTHFTQLDIDHIPSPKYLDKVLGYFSDPKVAWVQAPSVYGNFSHWTALGSAEQELVLQGPLQMGYFGSTQTPFIIGSHCTYDMKAIKKIGGFQPTRAEDHLDTVCLAAIGKRGVYLPEVIAVGDGPENFEMYIKQQFAWAYSMMQVLFLHTPRLIKNYTFHQAIQFLFAQTWYPAWSLSVVILFCVPLISLITNQPVSNVKFLEFITYSAPINLLAFAFWKWTKKWQQPKKVGISWRGIVLHSIRWIVVLQALLQVIFRVQKPYMITVKGVKKNVGQLVTLNHILPYIIFVGVILSVCWYYLIKYSSSYVQGNLLFALESSAILLLICSIVLIMDIKNIYKRSLRPLRVFLLGRFPIFILLTMWITWSVTAVNSTSRISSALFPAQKVNTVNAKQTELPSPTPINEVSPTRSVSENSEPDQPTPTVTPEPIDSSPSTHLVSTGESLWSIARKYYGRGAEWKRIKTVDGTSIIRPGEYVSIPKDESK